MRRDARESERGGVTCASPTVVACGVMSCHVAMETDEDCDGGGGGVVQKGRPRRWRGSGTGAAICVYIYMYMLLLLLLLREDGRRRTSSREREKREVGASHSNHHMIGGLSSPLGTTTQTDDLAKGLTVDLELERGQGPMSCDIM